MSDDYVTKAVEQAKPSQLTIDVAGGSLIGRRHSDNHDSFFLDDEGRVFLVADGMGSRPGAKLASQLAVDFVGQQFCDLPATIAGQQDMNASIQKILVAANAHICEQSQCEPQNSGMATTLVGAVRRRNELYVISVGDSRAYLIRDCRVEYCKEDQSMAQLFLSAGLLSDDQAATSRWRHVLWQCLGGDGPLERPLIETIELQPGDKVLLATDGLTNALTEWQLLQEMLRGADANQAAERLLDAANACEAADDATCVTMFVAG